MDKKVIWTDQIYRDIEGVAEYIAKDSEYYAAALVNEVLEKGESLTLFSGRGRVVPELKDKKVREIFVKSYRLIYQIEKDQVILLTLVHAKRDFSVILETDSEDMIRPGN